MPLLRSRPELLAGFRRGERVSLEAVYWGYVDRVERTVRYGFSVAQRGSRDGGTARDAIADTVQETFLRAFEERARHAYDAARDYGPYLNTIARNLVADWARKRGRELSLDDLEGPELASPPVDDEPWADPETVRCVARYIASLDDEARALHDARYERGLSQIQAAELLGLTRQTLRTRETRLRDGLIEALRAAKLGF